MVDFSAVRAIDFHTQVLVLSFQQAMHDITGSTTP